jgi:hypothetical protein
MTDEPHDGGNGNGDGGGKEPTGKVSAERMAIRRLRDSLRDAVVALTELEERIDAAPTEHRSGMLRAAAAFSGVVGVVGHDTRRELLKMEGKYPF